MEAATEETTASRTAPVFFVHRDADRWSDVAGARPVPPPALLRDRLREGVDCWIALTWLMLRRAGRDARLVRRTVPGEINVVHADDFIRARLRPDVFCAVVRPDRGPVLGADFRIVQNAALAGPSSAFVPHWPQPGLAPRASARGVALRRLVYMGRRLWLDPAFAEPPLAAELARRGIAFEIREQRWWDYRDADAVLAVRRCHPALLSTKPATKLTNAWLAGCLPLVGPEPAYASVGRRGVDYVEVEDPDALLCALDELQADESRYVRLREQGAARAAEFTFAAVARRWAELLDGPLAAAFARWRARGWRARHGRALVQRALEPARRAAWDRFDLRVGQLDPRLAARPGRPLARRVLARAELARRRLQPRSAPAPARLRQSDVAVSVVMAVHDGERHVGEAIESILGQTFGDLELIVIDDASRDGTARVLDRYRDPRLVRLRNPCNLGLTRTLNIGLRRARAPLVARLDHDDAACPARLARQVAWLRAHPATDVLGTWTTEVDADGAEIGAMEAYPSAGYLRFDLARRNSVYQSTVLMRRDRILALGGYDEALRFAQDHDLWTRVVMAGGGVELLPERLVRYRRSAAQISRRFFADQDRLGLEVRRRYASWLLGSPVTSYEVDAMRRLLRRDAVDSVVGPAAGFALMLRLQARAARGADRPSRRRIRAEVRDVLLHHAGAVLHAHGDVALSAELAASALGSGAGTLLHRRLWRHTVAIGLYVLRRRRATRPAAVGVPGRAGPR